MMSNVVAFLLPCLIGFLVGSYLQSKIDELKTLKLWIICALAQLRQVTELARAKERRNPQNGGNDPRPSGDPKFNQVPGQPSRTGAFAVTTNEDDPFVWLVFPRNILAFVPFLQALKHDPNLKLPSTADKGEPHE